ncbi:hypothetical protein BDV59DRAFT_170245 [Aspergillus ambiguus]|uniref:uncharacterized protein n=1 Tax=Aspergillus ambiguus TaxID=176160 RepID=UPI003CCE3522
MFFHPTVEGIKPRPYSPCLFAAPRMALFQLPPEVLMNIYCNLAHIHGVINLAQTCTAANQLLRQPRSRQQIFQSIIFMNDGAIQEDIKLSVLNKLYNALVAEGELHRDILSSTILSDFLAQFDGLTSYSLIDTIIIKSARYQSKLMEESNSTMRRSQTIIARSLHCLVIVSKTAHALYERLEEEDDIEGYCLQILESTSSDPIHSVNSITSLCLRVLDDLEMMVRQGSPREWPIILTVLCIFYWMTTEFERQEYNFQGLQDIEYDLGDPLGDLAVPLGTLSKMFYIQMEGNHPFQKSWNQNRYSTLVQEDASAMTQFEMLNRSWHIATCAESYEHELDLDGNGYQRVHDSDSFEHTFLDGMAGWMERLCSFCYGHSHVFESYPPFSATLELWALKTLDPSCSI